MIRLGDLVAVGDVLGVVVGRDEMGRWIVDIGEDAYVHTYVVTRVVAGDDRGEISEIGDQTP